MSEASEPRVIVQSAALRDALGLALDAADDRGREAARVDDRPAWTLARGDDGLVLTRPDGVSLSADFASGRARVRAGEATLAGQPLARALGIARLAARIGERPGLLDATAGLGVDGWQAAALGARVTMLERHPVVHALLADGLERARLAEDDRVRAIAGRVTLERADALGRLEAFAAAPPGARPALVYLDPMYPPARRRGRSRKGIEFLHALVGAPEDDGAALLGAALAAATYRVIVKRPTGAPVLPGPRGVDAQSLAAPNTRWDRYAVAGR